MKLLWILAGIRTEFLTKLISALSFFGEEMFAMTMLLSICWCINKGLAYRIGFTYFFSGLGAQTLKVVFRVPRPWVRDPLFTPVESALDTATGYSFPSCHTQSAAAIFGTLMFHFTKAWQRIICFVLILFIGFSRMYMGVHTPEDVAAALVFTFAVIWITDRIADSRPKTDDYFMTVILVVIAAVCTGYVYYLYSAGIVEDEYLNDICKMMGAALAFAASFCLETKYIKFSVRCGHWWMQPVKLIAGAGVLMGLRSGLKILLGTSPAASALRYFAMIIWAMLIYPMIIAAIQKRKGVCDETDKLEC